MHPNRNRGSTGFTAIEKLILIVLVMIQFTQIATFIMIMPLGDRLRRELSLTPSQFGSVVACYAWAASLTSLASGFVVDRLDRKHLLLVVYGGFALSTLACGLASGFGMLLVARTLAGAFGGLAASVVMIGVGDLFANDKRGRATGLVMSAFAIASILGLPTGLMLAEFFWSQCPLLCIRRSFDCCVVSCVFHFTFDPRSSCSPASSSYWRVHGRRESQTTSDGVLVFVFSDYRNLHGRFISWSCPCIDESLE